MQVKYVWNYYVLSDYYFLAPKTTVKDLQGHLQIQEFIPPAYSTMQRARSIAKEDIYGSIDVQFSKLPSLANQISQSDPEASVFLDVDEEGHFRNFFWAYGASKHFSNLQRKLFSVDGASMKSNPKLTLLVLASEDMEEQMIILALQLTKNVECEEEWSILKILTAVTVQLFLTVTKVYSFLSYI